MARPIARITAGSLCAGLLLLAAGCGRDSSAPPSPQDAVREKLRQVVSLWASDEPLADTLTRLGREYGLDIQVDEPALKANSISSSQKVSLHVAKIRLGSALHHLLREAPLSYDLDGSVVRVTHATALHTFSVGRIHPVADLADHGIDIGEEDLADLLRDIFGTDGPPDSIVAHPGVLVVSCPPLVQEEIARLLDDMRQLADPSTPPPEAKPTPAESAIARALETPVSVNYLQKPLADVLRELADQHGINIVVDRHALLDAGIVPEDTEITLQAKPKHLPLRAVLRLILRKLGLDYVVWHECLVITSTDVVHQTYMRPGLYALDGLLDRQNGIDEEAIREVVMNCAVPDHWANAGGAGITRVVPDGLLIHGMREAHDETVRTFAQLRRAMGPAVLDDEPLSSHPSAAWIEGKLAEATEFKFSDTTLTNVARYFIKRHDVPILFDHRALEDAGIAAADTLITRQLKGVSLRAGLQTVLEELGLDFIIDRSQRALIITSRYEAEFCLTTRFYRVGGLLGVVRPGKLTELVQNFVMPDSWMNAGGPASLEMLGNVLIVSQDHRGHHKVRQFLDALRRHVVPPPPKDLVIAAWPRNEAAERIERKLDEPTVFSFRHRTLKQVVDRLSKQHDMPIDFNRRALEDAGIVPEDRWITRSLKGTSLRSALWLVLGELHLDIFIHRGQQALMITSKDDADQRLTTYFYRVDGLIGDSGPLNRTRLIELLEKTVVIDSWQDAGGPGSIEHANTTLLISQTDRGHYYVKQFLYALSRFFGDPATGDVTVDDDAALEGKLQKALDRPTTLHAKDRSLSDVIDRLRELHPDTDLDFNRRALEAAAIVPEDWPVRLDVTDVPLRRALTQLCDRHSLGWVIQHGVIVLTSNKDAAQAKAPITIYRLPPQLVAERSEQDIAKTVYDHVLLKAWPGPRVVEPIPGGIIVVSSQPAARKTKRFLDELRAPFDAAGRR